MIRYVLAANYGEYCIWMYDRQLPLDHATIFVTDCNQLRGLGDGHEIVKVGDWTANPAYQPQLEAMLINVDLAEAQGAAISYG